MLDRLRSIVTSLAIASVIGCVAQAHASTSTQSLASQARVSTSGVAVQQVDYLSQGASIQAVTFRVSDPSVSMRIQLADIGGWYPCTNDEGSVRCDVHDFPASAVTRLEVTAG